MVRRDGVVGSWNWASFICYFLVNGFIKVDFWVLSGRGWKGCWH